MPLPYMPYKDDIVKKEQNKFRGLYHHTSAKDGDIYDMTNMCSSYFPAIGTRSPRYTVYTSPSKECIGMYGVNQDLFIVYKTATKVELYKNNTKISDELMSDTTEKRFAAINDYLIIIPDKVYYKFSDGTVGKLENTVSGTGFVFTTSVITVGASVDLSKFSKGDGITITGCTSSTHLDNNKTSVVQTVNNTAHTLTFYDNIFTAGTEAETVTLARTVPDMDYICENENRLWGCKDSTIYGSKLGDPFNFNVYNGLSTDSFAVAVGSAGDFTACISYLGYPIFFKENYIYKVYGSIASNFQTMQSATLGVKSGSHNSLAIAGEVLYYHSKAGIVAYTGGIPKIISYPLGDAFFSNAVGGSDGVRYYVCLTDNASQRSIYTYDTRHNTWHKESSTNILFYAYSDKLYSSENGIIGGVTTNYIRTVNEASSVTGAASEGNIASSLTFADFTNDEIGKKAISNILLRIDSEAGTTGTNSTVTVTITYDSDESTEAAYQFVNNALTKKTIYCKIIPRRCDHYKIKIESTTAFVLYSVAREYYSGSEVV